MDGNFFSHALDALIAMALGIFGHFLRGHNDRIRKIEESNRSVEKELYQFQTYSEKSFAKDETIKRVHDRIDEVLKILTMEKRG